MKRFEYLNGRPGYQYGIFSKKSGNGPKFGVFASTPKEAMELLQAKIGPNGLDRYEPRILKPTRTGNTWQQTVVLGKDGVRDVITVAFPSMEVRIYVDGPTLTAKAVLYHADGSVVAVDTEPKELFRKYVFKTTSRKFVVNLVMPEGTDE